ncbi:MAG TPA: hypothetical protein VJ810_30075, partial [Blastocatellia bacterium]|nr:hypothetical protein [Blastocatellia bacterium]
MRGIILRFPSADISSAYDRGDFASGMRDIWRNSRIESSADVPIEICDFETQGVTLFIVHKWAEAGFIAPIGFLILGESLVVATQPISEVVFSSVIA